MLEAVLNGIKMVIKYEHKPMLFERDDTTADMFGTLPVL
jgi:hypothetical protein